MIERKECPVCGELAERSKVDEILVFYGCPVCGRFELRDVNEIDLNKLSSYLFYNRFDKNDKLLRYHTPLDKEFCDTWRERADQGDTKHGRPVHMDREIVDLWYPSVFSERIDKILIKIAELSSHYGELIRLNGRELEALLFIDYKEYVEDPFSAEYKQWIVRKGTGHERDYMIDYLRSENLIEFSGGFSTDSYSLRLMPKGYSRVEEMQKNHAKGKKAFVAMQFGEETLLLREKIREGIAAAGYNTVLIDEVQHNNYIAPEIMKHIRDCKFVVVDLTHQNNGAYFEEGYAMGVGKPVIQLCKKDQKLHFDIAQKNTIIWETEDDIPKRLANRIKATID